MLCSTQDLSLFPVIFGHLSDVGVDHRNHVIIQCDVSTVGLGATLLQDGRPVASASRSLTKSEKNYLALELECLAIVFACQKFDQYIYSKPVRVETDHKPLEVIAKKSILSAPRRLQRMLLQPQRYNLDIVYLPGEQQVVADVLSRAPVEQPRGEQLGKAEVFQIVDQELAVIQEREFVSDAKMAAVRSAAVQGQEQAALRQIICQGWSPNIKQLPATVKAYWNFRDTMTVQDGIVYKGGQAVVPKELRKEFLQRLHSSHQGSQLTLKGARDAVYWPGMAEDIRRVTVYCAVCEKDSPAQPKEPQLSHSIPKKPWEKVGMDLFCWKGKNYLVIVDYLTDFFEIYKLQQTTAASVVEAKKSILQGTGFQLQYTQMVVLNSHLKSSRHL